MSVTVPDAPATPPALFVQVNAGRSWADAGMTPLIAAAPAATHRVANRNTRLERRRANITVSSYESGEYGGSVAVQPLRRREEGARGNPAKGVGRRVRPPMISRWQDWGEAAASALDRSNQTCHRRACSPRLS